MDGKQPCPPNTKLKKESILLPELGTHFIVRRKPSKTQRITLLSYILGDTLSILASVHGLDHFSVNGIIVLFYTRK